MNKPKYIKIDNELYAINTDFRVAIECNNISLDENIGDYERALAIIYKLFGEHGLKCTRMDKLLKLGMKYINICQKDKTIVKNDSDNDFDFDINKCEGLIRSSFKFDYNYDPYELKYLHWWDFYRDLSNLSTSEFGNCCILNRIANILNQDAKKIKDNKNRQKLIDKQKEFREKYCMNKKEKTKMSEKEEESAKAFYKSLGIDL